MYSQDTCERNPLDETINTVKISLSPDDRPGNPTHLRKSGRHALQIILRVLLASVRHNKNIRSPKVAWYAPSMRDSEREKAVKHRGSIVYATRGKGQIGRESRIGAKVYQGRNRRMWSRADGTSRSFDDTELDCEVPGRGIGRTKAAGAEPELYNRRKAESGTDIY